jgi:hypothetical protein
MFIQSKGKKKFRKFVKEGEKEQEKDKKRRVDDERKKRKAGISCSLFLIGIPHEGKPLCRKDLERKERERVINERENSSGYF